MAEQENKYGLAKFILSGLAMIALFDFLSKIWEKSETEKRMNEAKERSSASKDKLYKTIPPSYPEYTYEQWADQLDEALNSNLGEDEETVYKIFSSMKNISDVQNTIDHFGKREGIVPFVSYTLPQIIGKTFNAKEKAKLNGILRKNKIGYSFK